MNNIDYGRILDRCNGLTPQDIVILFFIIDNDGSDLQSVYFQLGMSNIEVNQSINNLTSRGLLLNRSGRFFATA